MERSTLSRRQLLERGIAACGALTAGGLLAACSGSSAPAAAGPLEDAPPFTGTLRVLGLGLDLTDRLHRFAEGDLGFAVTFERSTSPAMIERARTRPGSFDVLSGYTYQVDEIWGSGNLISVDRRQLEWWRQVSDLYKVGRVPGADCFSGDGDAPSRTLYTRSVHEAASPITLRGKGDEPPGLVGAPSTFTLDSLGYNSSELVREPEDVAWAELFNKRWRGRTALFDDPSFGLQAAALAAESAGLMHFRDKGKMTAAEIDALAKLLATLKRQGQFRTFWSTFDESVNLMAAGEVVVQYMWFPAVSLLQSLGQPVRYAAPPEGYLAWAGLLLVSKNALADRSRLRACYEYLNWWEGGVPGALLLSLGYYNAAMETSKPAVAADEWAYWIEGLPASSNLSTPFGDGSIPEGQRRDGGSMRTRECRIGTWLSSFGEQSEHQRRRWNELAGG